MIGFAFALSAAALLCAILGMSLAARAVTLASASSQVAAGFSPSQLQSLRSSVKELESTIEELGTSVRMMKTRRAGRMPDGNTTSSPDPYTDPDRWRQAMNSKLARGTKQ